MDKIRENLGIVVREAREKTGLTQSELSEKLGLGDKTILNIEKYSLQGTTQGRYLTGGVPPVRFSM